MAEKNFSTRIINKHDTEANWSKATNFIPKQGELIIYDADENNAKIRFKIGDGLTAVNALPFVIDGIAADWNQNDEAALNYIQNRTHWEEGTYILPETKVDIKSIYRKNLSLQDTINFVDGNVYDIVYNGKTYNVPTKFATNYYHFETVDFHIIVTNEQKVLQIMAYDGSSTVTLSIFENVDGVSTELFPETTTTLSAIGARAGILPEHLTDKIVVGETYNIHYNGFSCDVVAKSNSTQIQLLDPEDTFAIYIDTTEVQLPQITVLSGVTEANISIFSGEIHKLDNKYIDQRIVTKEIEKLNLQNGEAFGSVRNKISMAESDSYKLGTGAIALGSSSKATGPSGVSMGTATNAMGPYSVAIGNGSVASGNQSFAGGAMTEAIAAQSIAFGENVAATGVDSVAFGHGNRISITVSGDANATTYNCSSVSQLAAKMCVIYNDVRAWINTVNTSSGTITLDRTLSSTALTNVSVNVITNGAFGSYSFSGGNNSRATNDAAFAFGNGAVASGYHSVAMGNMVEASGQASLAIGNNNKATGTQSVALGGSNTVDGTQAFAAGVANTIPISASQAFAAGASNTASGIQSAAFGGSTKATGSQSFATGGGTTASGAQSIAMGSSTIASSQGSAAIGSEIVAIGDFSFAEGGNLDSTNDKNRILSLTITGDANATTYTCTSVTNLTTNHYVFIGSKFAKITSINTVNNTITLENTLSDTALSSVEAKAAKYGAFGKHSHSGGGGSIAIGENAFAHGTDALAAGSSSISIGSNTRATGNNSIAFGGGATASGEYSFSMGGGVTASGDRAVAFGNGSNASGDYSVAMGTGVRATGQASFSVGSGTVAEGDQAVAFGGGTNASGAQSVAFGGGTTASGPQSFAHGGGARATGYASFSMGGGTLAEGSQSVAFGAGTTASGPYSFAHGGGALAAGNFSFVHGTSSYTTITVTGNANATTYTCSSVSGISSGYYVVYNSTGIVAKVTSIDSTNKTITLEKTLSSSALSNVKVIAGSSGALSQFSHASGAGSLATGDYAFAHGNGAKATGVNSVAFGTGAQATSENAFTSGNNSKATGKSSFAHGTGAQALSTTDIAIGEDVVAYGGNSVALGYGSRAFGFNSFATGSRGFAVGTSSVSLGGYNSIYKVFITGEASSTSYTYNSDDYYVSGNYIVVRQGNSTYFTKIANIDTANKTITLETSLIGTALTNQEAFITSYGAIGNYSFCAGSSNLASGDYSVALGGNNKVDGRYSFSAGSINEVNGDYSFAAGYDNEVSGDYSATVGNYNKVNSNSYYSFASGRSNVINGSCSAALGSSNEVEGSESFACGSYSRTYGSSSFAGGYHSIAAGQSSFAHGYFAAALGFSSHAEGYVSGNVHVLTISGEGNATTYTCGPSDYPSSGSYICYGESIAKIISVSGKEITVDRSLSYGTLTNAKAYSTGRGALGSYSHVEGQNTTAIGIGSHAEGTNDTTAKGYASHAEGNRTKANGEYSHAEGNYTEANGRNSHAEGYETKAIGNDSHAEGDFTEASGDCSHTEGYRTKATSYGAHAEGHYTEANDSFSHAEGNSTKATSSGAHAEGSNTIASGEYSHAEGSNSEAIGSCSHSEGSESFAMSYAAHAEGTQTFALGQYSHAEGNGGVGLKKLSITGEANTTTYTYETVDDSSKPSPGEYLCQSNGNFVKITSVTDEQITIEKPLSSWVCNGSLAYAVSNGAFGMYSHTEGYYTTAIGRGSHAEGLNSIASGENQHVQGKNNIEDTEGKYAHIVGNGEALDQRSNAHTLDWEGNSWYQSSVRVGGTDQEAAPTTLAANGLILTDETTGTKYRIFVTNAKLTMEVVEE